MDFDLIILSLKVPKKMLSIDNIFPDDTSVMLSLATLNLIRFNLIQTESIHYTMHLNFIMNWITMALSVASDSITQLNLSLHHHTIPMVARWWSSEKLHWVMLSLATTLHLIRFNLISFNLIQTNSVHYAMHLDCIMNPWIAIALSVVTDSITQCNSSLHHHTTIGIVW